MTIKEYIENEEYELEKLEEKLSNLKKKWFKTSSKKQEIEFLEFYIKEKQKLIDEMKKK